MKRILLLVLAVFSLTLPLFSQNYMLVHKSDGNVWEIPVDKVDSVSFVFKQPTNEIWYTTTDGNVVTPYNVDGFGASIVSNEYNDGKGVITFDGPVTMIGDESSNGGDWKPFYNCRTLSTISLPSSVRKIGYSAFGSCSSLKELILPDSLDFLGPGIVSYAPLTTITIPESAVIDGNPVYWCSSLSEFKGPYATDDGYALVKDKTLISFVNEGVTQYVVPNSVTAIGESAFIDCNDLIIVTLHNGVTSIGWGAFMRCSNLTGFVIPESVRSVGFGAFKGTSLTSIHIPENTTFEGCPFDGCNSLASFSGRYASSDGRCLVDDRNRVFAFAPSGLKEYSMPEGITAIRGGFEGVTGLEDLILPSTITEITQINSSSIKNITCLAVNPPRVTYASNSGLSYLRSLEHIYVPKGSVDAYKAANVWSNHAGKILPIPEEPTGDVQPNNEIWYTTIDGVVITPENTNCFGANIVSNTYNNGKGIIKFDGDVTMVGDETINTSSDAPFNYIYTLETISLPQSVRKIGFATFYNCRNLKSIDMPDSLEYLGGSFVECTSVKELFIPETKNISSNPCFDNDSLSKFTGPYASSDGRCLIRDNKVLSFAPAGIKSYAIPDGIVELGSRAFSNSYELQTITFPSSLRKIGIQCFVACSALKDLIIPETVSSIEVSAFYGCTSLSSIHIPEQTEISSGVFDACSSLTEFTGRYASADGRCLVKYNSIYAFAPKGLTEYRIPDGIKGITYGFDYLKELKKLTIPSSVTGISFIRGDSIEEITCLAVTPPKIDYSWSLEFRKIEAIYVPAESVDAYKAAFGWSVFADYIKALQDNQSAGQQGSSLPDDEIWYTSTDGEIVTLHNDDGFGATLVSNTYADGKGILKFDSPLTSIGDMTFGGITTLLSIDIPASVDTIGVYVFRGCRNLASISVDPNNTSYDSRNDCNAIIETATNKLIAGCNNTVIPSDVTGIGDYALYGFGGLLSLDIPSSVSSIGIGAFFGCTGLKTVVIPTSVTSIGMACFAGCSGLTSISVAAGNSMYDSRNGCNAIIETSTNTLLAGMDNTVIPDDVTSIGPYAFYCCSFTTLDIPQGVTSIGEGAFSACSRLSSLTIPEGVTNIETLTFGDCSSLTSVIIPESVTSIGEHAFSRSGLTSINIPAGVRSIGFDAFGQCSNLASVTISENDTIIGDYAFRYCSSLTSVVIPAAVKSIGEDAFYGCSSLEHVDIMPATPPSIGSYSFGYDDDYPIYVPAESVAAYKAAENWSDYADRIQAISDGQSGGQQGSQQPNNEIWYTSSDGEVVTPNHEDVFGASLISNTYLNGKGVMVFDAPIISIGLGGFDGCSELISVNIPEGVNIIEMNAFLNCTALESVSIPSTVSEFGRGAFSGCISLGSIVLPKGITSIENDLFFNCSSLASITIPSGVTRIGDNAFEGCLGLTTMLIPEGVISVGDEAFGGCENLLSVSNPSSLREIGMFAFNECESLTTINIPDSVSKIDFRTFYNCKSITSIIIPENVISLGDGAFYGCSGLESVTIPGKILNIGQGAFMYCDSLKEVNILEGVESIGEYAFGYCENLSSLIIPSTVQSIDDEAFCGCYVLTYIKVLSAEPPVGGLNMFGATNNCPIYVPAESVAAYKAAENWSDYADRIQAIP